MAGEDEDVTIPLDDAAIKGAAEEKTADELAAEKAIDELVAADREGKPEPERQERKSAEEGQEDLAAQLKAARETADAERRAADTARRERDEERKRAERFEGDAIGRQGQVLAAAIETIGMERASAKAAYIAAQEAGDYAASAEAQEAMSLTAAKLVRLQEAKSQFDAERARRQPTHEGRVEPKPTTRTADAEFEDAVSSLSPKSQEWARRNPTMFTDPKKYPKVLAAHYGAVGQDIAPDTPEYFAHLETELGLRQRPAEERPAPQQRQPALRTSAPVGREANGTGGSGGSVLQNGNVRLSPAQREAARMAGVTDREYAIQLVKIERAEMGAQ